MMIGPHPQSTTQLNKMEFHDTNISDDSNLNEEQVNDMEENPVKETKNKIQNSYFNPSGIFSIRKSMHIENFASMISQTNKPPVPKCVLPLSSNTAISIDTSKSSQTTHKLELKSNKKMNSMKIVKKSNIKNEMKIIEMKPKKHRGGSLAMERNYNKMSTRTNSTVSIKCNSEVNKRNHYYNKQTAPQTVVLDFESMKRIIPVAPISKLKSMIIKKKDIPSKHERKILSNEYVMYCYM